jgi:hypothetical protein
MHKWALTMQTEDELEPLTVAEALESKHWREAMKRGYQSLVHKNTWKLVPLPPNKTMVSGERCCWAKTDAGGTVQPHKAMYVARGFTPRPGVDFTKTTSLVVALTSLWALLAIATKRDMEIKHLDVGSAF